MSMESILDEFVKKTEKRLGELERTVQELESQIEALRAHPQGPLIAVGRYASRDEVDQIKKRVEELEDRVSDAEGPPSES